MKKYIYITLKSYIYMKLVHWILFFSFFSFFYKLFLTKHYTGTLKKSRGKKKNMMGKALEDNPLGRKVLFSQARKMAAKATGGNYP